MTVSSNCRRARARAWSSEAARGRAPSSVGATRTLRAPGDQQPPARRARAAFESRLPTTARDRAPLPSSKLERELVGSFVETVENGDIGGMLALLTDDAWLTMPPLPHAYQGRDAIGAFLRGAEVRRGAPMSAGVDARKHAAGVRLLPAGPGHRRCACLLAARPDPRRPPNRSLLRGSPTAACFRSSAFRARCRGERQPTPRAAPLAVTTDDPTGSNGRKPWRSWSRCVPDQLARQRLDVWALNGRGGETGTQ